MPMPPSPFLEELRLTRFKSFRDAVLPLRDLTLLIGRNGSGKSNAIDGLHVLARLAEGEDLREAIDGGRREGGEVRGGVGGCAPYGESTFALGCTVRVGDDLIDLDVEVQVEPDVQIISEALHARPARGRHRAYLTTDRTAPGLFAIQGRYFNGKQGPNPVLPFRPDRLLTAQVPTKVPGNLKATRQVHEAAEVVIAALRSVFILDPVPALMRQYVPRRDVTLRRQADNLSAVVGALREDTERWEQLKEIVQALPEQHVASITVESSALEDVMLALHERFAGQDVPFSARVMSDGMLRFLAFAAALLEAPALETTVEDDAPHTLLVIEEIENGLHPSQAARVVRLIKAESQRRRIRTLATTHSPAMLTALDATDHDGVIVCLRHPETARTELVPLVDLASYPAAMAAGTLGDAVTQQRLEGTPDSRERRDTLEELLATL